MAIRHRRAVTDEVVYVQNLIDKAQALIDKGTSDADAADAVLQGVDLFNLIVVDGAEVARLFRDGFLHKLNRLNSPSRWYTPGVAVNVDHPASITITKVETDAQPPVTVRVKFLNAQYQVSRGNLFVRQMFATDLIEAGNDLIHQGQGMVRKGTVLSVDTVAALRKYKVDTPAQLPTEVLVELQSKFNPE